MIFRCYMLCWLALGCAENINRPQISGSSALWNGLRFGSYVLEEVAQEPTNMPAPSDPATLKDVKFISKISPTESLLVTDKNVTWKYDEEKDTLTKMTYTGSKQDGIGSYVQNGTAEYGFEKHIARVFSENSKKGKILIDYDTGSDDEEFDSIDISESLYDAQKPPRILYFNGDRKEKRSTSVFVITGKTFVLKAPDIKCETETAYSVKISRVFKEKDKAESVIAGMGNDDKSFWLISPDTGFALYIWHGCKLEDTGKTDTEGKKVTSPQHKYEGFGVKFDGSDEVTPPPMTVTYQGNNVTDLPLGMWIDVSDKKNPVIIGRIIAISKEGKLLSAEELE